MIKFFMSWTIWWLWSSKIMPMLGMSRTVETFLKTATHYHNYTVIIAKTASSYRGCKMAKSLLFTGVSTFLVPEIHLSSPLCHESINSYSVHMSSLLMVVCLWSLVLRLWQQQQWHIVCQLWYLLVNLFWHCFGISIMLMMHWTLVIPVISLDLRKGI